MNTFFIKNLFEKLYKFTNTKSGQIIPTQYTGSYVDNSQALRPKIWNSLRTSWKGKTYFEYFKDNINN